jgi:SAM-dependent methyltransferase
MNKQLARLEDSHHPDYIMCMEEINKIAHEGGLQEYTTYCRIWEYPWVWFQLEPLKGHKLRMLDVGSEKSSFPWFLAKQGFDVVVSDVTPKNWQLWEMASRELGVNVHKRILDAQDLDLHTASVDIYLSVSVIEHISNKPQVIAEAARVLRPDGLFVMTFDICEQDMGMTFPEWNGRALTMQEFDELFKNSPWFESGLSDLAWNTEDIPDFLAWHRITAPWHNYVAGAAVIQRSALVWQESWRISSSRWVRSMTRRSRQECSYALGLQVQRLRQRFPVRTTMRRIWRTLRNSS